MSAPRYITTALWNDLLADALKSGPEGDALARSLLCAEQVTGDLTVYGAGDLDTVAMELVELAMISSTRLTHAVTSGAPPRAWRGAVAGEAEVAARRAELAARVWRELAAALRQQGGDRG